MQIKIGKAIVKEVRQISSQKTDWKGQILSVLDESGGDVDFTADVEVDFSKLPLIQPVSIEATVKPVRKGFNQALLLTGFSFKIL